MGDSHDYYDYEYYGYYYNNYTYDNDFHEGSQIYNWILVAGVIPVCILGLAANTVSVWVWNASKKHSPVVMLFQCLGVLDNIFLLVSAVRAGLHFKDQLTEAVERYIFPVLYLSQSLSVHVTMIIGVFRWLAVARPQRTQCMKRRHVIMTCAGLGTWCTLLTTLVIVKEGKVEQHGTASVVMFVVLQVVGFVLPILVLLAFSIVLLRITFQHQRQQSMKKRTRTTTAVLSIATSSFLACPVGVAGHLLAVLSWHQADSACTWTCLFAALGVGDLLQVLNSSINFFFYFFFASKFKPLLRQTCGRSKKRRDRQRKFSTTSSIQMTSDSDSGTQSSSFHQSENAEKSAEEALDASSSAQGSQETTTRV